jgi:hypothetical protein
VGLNLALTRLFAPTTAFVAKAEVQSLDLSRQETLKAAMDFIFLEGKLRIQIDLSEFKHKDFPPALANSLKQLGLSQVVSIMRPDKLQTSIVYPEMQSLLTLPLPKADADVVLKTPQIEKTVLGKETLNGRACVKHKVLIKSENGQTVSATVWNASDLKDFPVQIETVEKDSISILRFKEVQFVKPDARQFETPASYKQYADYPAMIKGLMSKLMGMGGEAN